LQKTVLQNDASVGAGTLVLCGNVSHTGNRHAAEAQGRNLPVVKEDCAGAIGNRPCSDRIRAV
jgi:hypothetical protein